jgi:hypothetical protein
MRSVIARAVLVLAAVILLGSLCGAAHASGGEYLYWANGLYNTIERSNLAGTRVDPRFITVAGRPIGVAVSSQYIYWTDSSGIGRANLDGSHVNNKFIAAPKNSDPNGLAVNGKYIYWAESGTNKILRADLHGAHVDTSYLTGADGVASPSGVAVDATYIYWTDPGTGTIGRATIDGKTVWQHFITGGIGPVAVAVNGSYIYWGNYGDSIGRANLDGSHVNQYLIKDSPPDGVAVTSQYLYWTNNNDQSIGRANLDGSVANMSFIAPAQDQGQIAVSPNATIPPYALPVPVRSRSPLPTAPGKTTVPKTTTTTTTTTPITSGTATTVTVTAGSPGTYTFTLSSSTQPKVVSDTPGVAELNVPPGAVVFDVSNPSSGIVSHTFEVCTTPLTKPIKTLSQVQSLPDSCSGDVTPLLSPGATATLKVTLATPGAYEYLSTANNPDGDAFSGMKGVLNIT